MKVLHIRICLFVGDKGNLVLKYPVAFQQLRKNQFYPQTIFDIGAYFAGNCG